MSLQVKICQVLVIFFTVNQHNYVNCEGQPTLKSFSSTNLRTLAVNLSNSDEMFSQLLRPMLIVRVPDTEGNLIVQNHIKAHMSNFGWTVEDDPFEDMTPIGSKKFNNIIATHNPRAKKRLIIACHFDSKLFKFEFVGATDSAVPCAIMLDIAKQLSCFMDKKRDEADDVTLQFVFFDGEEAFQSWTDTDSIYGARHLAKKWSEENDPNIENNNKLETINALILLDLIGASGMSFKNYFENTKYIFQRLMKIESNLLDKDLLLKDGDFYRKFFSKHPSHGSVQDDHIPFLYKGVPIVHLISTPFPSVWHKAGDNMNALVPRDIENFTRILKVFVAQYFHLKVGTCRK